MWFSLILYGYNTSFYVLSVEITATRQERQYFPLKFQQDFSLELINSNVPDTIYAVWRTNIRIMTYCKRQKTRVPLIVFKVTQRILGLETAEINADIWCKTTHFSSLTTSIMHFQNITRLSWWSKRSVTMFTICHHQTYPEPVRSSSGLKKPITSASTLLLISHLLLDLSCNLFPLGFPQQNFV